MYTLYCARLVYLYVILRQARIFIRYLVLGSYMYTLSCARLVYLG